MLLRQSIPLKMVYLLALSTAQFIAGTGLLWAIPAPSDRSECALCHQEMLPEKGEVDGPAAWEDSVHAQVGIGCIDCHREQGRAGLPDPLPEPVQGDSGQAHDLIITQAPDQRARLSGRCSACHDEQAETVGHSVHGAWAKEHRPSVAPLCIDCHASHRLPGVAEEAPRRDRALWLRHPADGAMGLCIGCHAERGRSYLEGLHGRLHMTGVPGTPVCLDCHSAHAPPRSDIASTVHPQRVGELCVQCHAEGRPKAEQEAMTAHLIHAGSAAGAAAHRQDEVRGGGDPVRWIVVGYAVFGTVLLLYLILLNVLATYRCRKEHQDNGPKNHLWWWLLLPLLFLPEPVQAHDGPWIDLDTPCIDCHLHRKEQGQLLRERMADSLAAAHRPIEGGVTCASCHGQDQTTPAPDVMNRAACLKCHQEEQIATVQGMGFHGEPRHRGGDFRCTDCHMAHEPGRSQNRFVQEKRTFARCLACHPKLGD